MCMLNRNCKKNYLLIIHDAEDILKVGFFGKIMK